MEKFEAKQYRDELAEELKQEKNKENRRRIIEEASGTLEYREAKRVTHGESIEEQAPQANVNIFYMRHGKPEGKYAHADMPYEEFLRAATYDESLKLGLSEEGRIRVREELEKSGVESHNIKLILASPYLRTLQTAELVQEYLRDKTGKEILIKKTELLAEVRVDPNTLSKDEYEKILAEEGFWRVMDEFSKRWMHDANAFETVGETYQRAEKLLKYLRRVRKWTEYDKVFMVSHGWFGRVIKHVANGGRREDFERDTRLISEAEMYALQHREDDQFIELGFKNENL